MEDKEIMNFENCVLKDFCNDDSENINNQNISKNDSNNMLFDDEYPGDCKGEISDVVINDGDSGREYFDSYGRDSDLEQDCNSLEITADSVCIKEESVEEHSDENHVEDCKSKHLGNLSQSIDDDDISEKDSVQVIFGDDYPGHCKLEHTENLSEVTTDLIANEGKSVKNFDNESICNLSQTSKYSCDSCDDECLVNCKQQELINPSQTIDNLDKYSLKSTLVVINDRINNEEEIEQKSAVSSIKNSFSRILEIFSGIERNSEKNIACNGINVWVDPAEIKANNKLFI